MPTSTATVATTTDDGYFNYWRDNTLDFSNSSIYLEIRGFEGDDDDNPDYKESFIRFTGTLPSQGDLLTSATLNLTSAINKTFNFRIYGCSDISPSAPTNNSMGFELGRTSNYVLVTASSSQNVTEQYDVTSIVQEMLNDPDFGGGEIMLILTENVSDSTTGGRRYYSSNSATSSYRPTLDLDWSSGGGTNATTLRRRLTTDQDTDGTLTSNALMAYHFVNSAGSQANPTSTSSGLMIRKWSGDDDDDPRESRVYLRFSGNASSQLVGATINSANLYYRATYPASYYSAGDAVVKGHAAASPDMPGALSGLRSLPETTATVGLPRNASIEFGAGSYQEELRYSLDLTSIVQELVNIPSYDGSAVMLILRGNGSSFGTGAAESSYSLGSPSQGVELYLDVEFQIAAPDTPDTPETSSPSRIFMMFTDF